MAHAYPNAIAMGMDSGKPIAMGTKSDMEMINQYDIVDKDGSSPIIEEDKQNWIISIQDRNLVKRLSIYWS